MTGVSAAAALVISVTGLCGALSLLIPILRATRDTHRLVNAQHVELQNQKRRLSIALAASATAVLALAQLVNTRKNVPPRYQDPPRSRP